MDRESWEWRPPLDERAVAARNKGLLWSLVLIAVALAISLIMVIPQDGSVGIKVVNTLFLPVLFSVFLWMYVGTWARSKRFRLRVDPAGRLVAQDWKRHPPIDLSGATDVLVEQATMRGNVSAELSGQGLRFTVTRLRIQLENYTDMIVLPIGVPHGLSSFDLTDEQKDDLRRGVEAMIAEVQRSSS